MPEGAGETAEGAGERTRGEEAMSEPVAPLIWGALAVGVVEGGKDLGGEGDADGSEGWAHPVRIDGGGIEPDGGVGGWFGLGQEVLVVGQGGGGVGQVPGEEEPAGVAPDVVRYFEEAGVGAAGEGSP